MMTGQCDGAHDAGIRLEYAEGRLVLTDGTLTLFGDFSRLLPRIRRERLGGEMLIHAAKTRGEGPFRAIDATAGLGEDAFLLAAAGFEVDLYERDPVIAALLEDALRRAAEAEEGGGILADITGRMHLRREDSIPALQSLAEGADGISPLQSPDVVLLDPMFPERKKSGLIKKKFQLLQQLEEPCGREEELMEAAFAAHPGKIVVKRPLKGPHLAGKTPSYSLKGKAIRYDCYVPV